MARIGFIVDERFDDDELRIAFDRVKQEGHQPVVVGAKAGRTLEGRDKREQLTTELAAGDVTLEALDGLVVPGGEAAGLLRGNEAVRQLVRTFNDAAKPIAAIDHGVSVLAAAGILHGEAVPCRPELEPELAAVGAQCIDREVLSEGNFVIGRDRAALDNFCEALVLRLRPEALPRAQVVPAPSPELEEKVERVGPH